MDGYYSCAEDLLRICKYETIWNVFKSGEMEEEWIHTRLNVYHPWVNIYRLLHAHGSYKCTRLISRWNICEILTNTCQKHTIMTSLNMLSAWSTDNGGLAESDTANKNINSIDIMVTTLCTFIVKYTIYFTYIDSKRYRTPIAISERPNIPQVGNWCLDLASKSLGVVHRKRPSHFEATFHGPLY